MLADGVGAKGKVSPPVTLGAITLSGIPVLSLFGCVGSL
jgi:hypothetical protein